MVINAYDLKAFYCSQLGRVVARTLSQEIRAICGSARDLEILGCGYVLPFFPEIEEQAARIIAHMPRHQGMHAWPEAGLNKVLVSEEDRLPFEKNSFDRVLLIHDLEFSGQITGHMAEIWRVLKPNGKMVVIVPNRTGLWAQAEWVPFGSGRPYTSGQISKILRAHEFFIESYRKALFFPPLTNKAIIKSSAFLEKYSRYFWPFGGVHVLEATKQIYARPRPPRGSKVEVTDMAGIRLPKPAGMTGS